MKHHFTLASSGTEDVDLALLESLVECYNNAFQWDARRQILSIMVDKVSFKSLQRVDSKRNTSSFQNCQTAPIAAW